MTSHVNVGYA